MTVGVIGAGPAGIMAALAARSRGARVLLFDTNRTVGRKLLVTGNGRCNITNAHVSPERYVCAYPGFLQDILSQFDVEWLCSSLKEIGILTYATEDGWFYPLSNSAASVVDALSAALEVGGVETHLTTKIDDVRPTDQGYTVLAGGGSSAYEVDRVVVACGGKAYPALGSSGSFLPVIESLGHTIVEPLPALVPVRVEMGFLNKLQGVRLDVALALYEENGAIGEVVGNMMFTSSGLSGPAPMNLSYLVSTRGNSDLTLSINLIPYHMSELRELLERHRGKATPLRVLLSAVMPPKVPPVLLAQAGIPEDAPLNALADSEVGRVLSLACGITVKVKGTRGFKFAQLSTGGVPVVEVNPVTMESLWMHGLYFAGEVLDVVGPCGGFNLHFAFASGAAAGTAAAS